MAAEQGKVDPMHQFTIEPVVPFEFAGYDLSFTNSAMWMLVTTVVPPLCLPSVIAAPAESVRP